MRFGPVPVDKAAGTILAHSLAVRRGRIKKGERLDASHIQALTDAGIAEVIVATLDPDDVPENEAAKRIADKALGENIRCGAEGAGRTNLFATANGIAIIDRRQVDAVNAIDEGATIATVPPFTRVQAGDLVATVKTIPLALPRRVVEACENRASHPTALLRVAAFEPRRVALIQTELPGTMPKVLAKAERVTRDRIISLGGSLKSVATCRHDEDAVSRELSQAIDQGCDLILLLGASAIVDRRDVVPASLLSCGGEIIQFGMPVDPGNLTLLGRLGGADVLGLPGSARSPRTHGFDWIMERLFAGQAVTSDDVRRLGVGGLLKEIPSRPMPRTKSRAPRRAKRLKVGAIILASGQSRRMGEQNKLLAELAGTPMIRQVVENVSRSAADPVLVVVGHDADRVESALSGSDVTVVTNPDYEDGISASIRHGVAALPDDVDGVIICLGDMPEVEAKTIDALVAAFERHGGDRICVPFADGKRGNPVVWGRRYFNEMRKIEGDVGAKQLLGMFAGQVVDVPVDDMSILTDIDSPSALSALRSRMS